MNQERKNTRKVANNQVKQFEKKGLRKKARNSAKQKQGAMQEIIFET